MPLYEYECIECGARFEVRRNLADRDSEVECSKCGAKHPLRVFSSFCTCSSGGSGASRIPT